MQSDQLALGIFGKKLGLNDYCSYTGNSTEVQPPKLVYLNEHCGELVGEEALSRALHHKINLANILSRRPAAGHGSGTPWSMTAQPSSAASPCLPVSDSARAGLHPVLPRTLSCPPLGSLLVPSHESPCQQPRYVRGRDRGDRRKAVGSRPCTDWMTSDLSGDPVGSEEHLAQRKGP